MKKGQSEMVHTSDSVPDYYDYDILQNLYYPIRKRTADYDILQDPYWRSILKRAGNKNKQRKLAEKYYAIVFNYG